VVSATIPSQSLIPVSKERLRTLIVNFNPEEEEIVADNVNAWLKPE
jgi:hypothetical protein